MKILIIADLRGNAEALAALPQNYDQLWVLGDLVNYGTNPREIIDFVRSHASVVVRGNHDNAIGFDTDPRCSGPYKSMAAEMGRFTQAALTADEKAYLRMLASICHAGHPRRPPRRANIRGYIRDSPCSLLF